VTIRWVRDSAGIVTAKLLAEKSNPQADMAMGLAGGAWTVAVAPSAAVDRPHRRPPRPRRRA